MNSQQIVHFPSAIQYAFRGLLFLAGKPNEQIFNVDEIAKATALPADFLAKIFQRLAAAGIVQSKKGPGGGYALLKPADKIRLAEVVEMLIDFEFKDRLCLLGLGRCGSSEKCPLHILVKNTEKKVFEILNDFTLRDLQDPAPTL